MKLVAACGGQECRPSLRSRRGPILLEQTRESEGAERDAARPADEESVGDRAG